MIIDAYIDILVTYSCLQTVYKIVQGLKNIQDKSDLIRCSEECFWTRYHARLNSPSLEPIGPTKGPDTDL